MHTAIPRACDPYRVDGPHVLTGPVAVRGARAGDVLGVDMLVLEPRVPDGVISNRHGLGLLDPLDPRGPPRRPGGGGAGGRPALRSIS